MSKKSEPGPLGELEISGVGKPRLSSHIFSQGRSQGKPFLWSIEKDFGV